MAHESTPTAAPQRTNSSDFYHPHSVEELTRRNVETVSELEASAQQQRSRGDVVADHISSFCGSMRFVWVHIIWFGVWIGLNTALPHKLHFDPFPFQFLTFTVSLEAIFLSTFVLISQNRESRIADRRNHLDLQVNLLAEQENTKMLEMLEAISHKLGVEISADPSLKMLETATDPQVLIEQIDATMAGADRKKAEKQKAA